MPRVPDYVKHKFERIIKDSNADKKFMHILKNTRKEEVFLKAYEMCNERAFGKAPQFTELELNDVTERPNREELDAALRSLNGHPEGNGVVEGE